VRRFSCKALLFSLVHAGPIHPMGSIELLYTPVLDWCPCLSASHFHGPSKDRFQDTKMLHHLQEHSFISYFTVVPAVNRSGRQTTTWRDASPVSHKVLSTESLRSTEFRRTPPARYLKMQTSFFTSRGSTPPEGTPFRSPLKYLHHCTKSPRSSTLNADLWP
jgi:hypothetical protein